MKFSSPFAYVTFNASAASVAETPLTIQLFTYTKLYSTSWRQKKHSIVIVKRCSKINCNKSIASSCNRSINHFLLSESINQSINRWFFKIQKKKQAETWIYQNQLILVYYSPPFGQLFVPQPSIYFQKETEITLSLGENYRLYNVNAKGRREIIRKYTLKYSQNSWFIELFRSIISWLNSTSDSSVNRNTN